MSILHVVVCRPGVTDFSRVHRAVVGDEAMMTYVYVLIENKRKTRHLKKNIQDLRRLDGLSDTLACRMHSLLLPLGIQGQA